MGIALCPASQYATELSENINRQWCSFTINKLYLLYRWNLPEQKAHVIASINTWDKIDGSQLKEHAISENHSINFESSEILDLQSNFKLRRLLESAFITINKDIYISH